MWAGLMTLIPSFWFSARTSWVKFPTKHCVAVSSYRHIVVFRIMRALDPHSNWELSRKHYWHESLKNHRVSSTFLAWKDSFDRKVKFGWRMDSEKPSWVAGKRLSVTWKHNWPCKNKRNAQRVIFILSTKWNWVNLHIRSRYLTQTWCHLGPKGSWIVHVDNLVTVVAKSLLRHRNAWFWRF